STLLRVLSGELRASRGTVEVEGRPLASYARRDLARVVAVVPQETVAAFPFTVGEMVLMGRAPRVGRLALEGEADVAAARRARARPRAGAGGPPPRRADGAPRRAAPGRGPPSPRAPPEGARPRGPRRLARPQPRRRARLARRPPQGRRGAHGGDARGGAPS